MKYISVYLLSMFKFIFGPTMGFAYGFAYYETLILTVAGMMTSVLVFTYLGEQLRENVLKKFYSRINNPNKKNQRYLKIWEKYGTFGVSFLTPLLFSPIGGTIILTTLGAPRSRIIPFMLISAVFWAFVLSYLVYFLGYKLG